MSNTMNNLKKDIYGMSKYSILNDKDLNTGNNTIISDIDNLLSLGNLLRANSTKLEDQEHDIHIAAYVLSLYNEAISKPDMVSLTQLYIFLKDYTNDIMEDTNMSCIILCTKIRDKVEKFLKENYMKIFE